MTSIKVLVVVVLACALVLGAALLFIGFYKELYTLNVGADEYMRSPAGQEQYLRSPSVGQYKINLMIEWGGHVQGASTGEILVIVHDTNFVPAHFGSGSYASPGLQEAAEYGKVNKLEEELSAVRGTFLYKFAPVKCPADVSFQVPADVKHPYITLITMLAPSQDFFVLAETDIYKTDKKRCPQISYVPLYALKASTQRRSICVTKPKEPVLAKERIRYFALGEDDQVSIGWFGICAV